jgi:hypothetical protein
MQLDPADIPTDRQTHFRAANRHLADAMESDADFRALIESIAGPDIMKNIITRNGRGRPISPAGWIWQHATRSQANGQIGVMQLVPKVEHTPGSVWWRKLHPLKGAAGGYAEWAIPLGAKRN